MKNESVLKTVLALILVCGAAGAQQKLGKGTAIAKMVSKFNDGYVSESSTMTMTLTNAHGDSTSRRMKAEQIEFADDGDRSRIEFEWPADVKGTRLLTWSHRKENDDQWIFLPVVRRVKRISSGNQSGSFLGSEFAYEDLGSQEVEKYTHRFVAEATLDARNTWQLEQVPTSKNSGYSRLMSWIDKEYRQPLKVVYYDRKGEKLKTAKFEGYEAFGKWHRASSVTMKNHQTKKTSTMAWSKRVLGTKIRKKTFQSDKLGD